MVRCVIFTKTGEPKGIPGVETLLESNVLSEDAQPEKIPTDAAMQITCTTQLDLGLQDILAPFQIAADMN